MRTLRSLSAMVLACSLGLLAGCGSSMVQIEGKIVWADGTPAKELEGGEVVFESAELKVNARGEIGPDGNFKLRTAKPGDGCIPGTYQVAVLEFRKAGKSEGNLAPAIMDPKFADLKTSGLTETVKSGGGPITITVNKAKK